MDQPTPHAQFPWFLIATTIINGPMLWKDPSKGVSYGDMSYITREVPKQVELDAEM